jgi:WD40 repeat protein
MVSGIDYPMNTVPTYRRAWPFLFTTACILAWQSPAVAQQPTYWQDVRPIFRKHCTVCHSAKNVKEVDVSGGLALDSYEAVRKGTKHPVIAAGKSSDSILMQLVTTNDKSKRMPLDASPLATESIAVIKKWIDAGAPEGTRPEETLDPIITKKSGTTRKLDVILATTTIPSTGALGSAKAGKLELSLKIGPLAPAVAVAFSPDGKLLATGSYGQVTIWDLAKVQPVKVLTNVLGAVNDLRFSPDGLWLAVGGGQPAGKGDLRLYQVADWKLLATMRDHDDVVFSLAFHPKEKRLASASFDKTVRVWSVADGKLLKTFDHHSDFVYSVAYSPDGKRLVSGSKDRSVKIIDAATGKGMFSVSDRDQDVLCVAFSPDGNQIVASGLEPGITVWDPKTGEKSKTLAGHGVAVHELAFSKDGKVLVSAGGDKTVKLWNGATAPAAKTFAVGSVVYAIAVSPDRKWIATGSFDGLVRLWDESGRHLVTLLALPHDKHQIDWLAFTPEGYSAGNLTTVGRWRMGGVEIASDPVWSILRRPEMVALAVAGKAVTAPVFGK